MWQVNKPEPVKLIIGILAANKDALDAAQAKIADHFGESDLVSEVWPFTQTTYYQDEMGTSVLRRFVSVD